MFVLFCLIYPTCSVKPSCMAIFCTERTHVRLLVVAVASCANWQSCQLAVILLAFVRLAAVWLVAARLANGRLAIVRSAVVCWWFSIFRVFVATCCAMTFCELGWWAKGTWRSWALLLWFLSAKDTVDIIQDKLLTNHCFFFPKSKLLPGLADHNVSFNRHHCHRVETSTTYIIIFYR